MRRGVIRCTADYKEILRNINYLTKQLSKAIKPEDGRKTLLQKIEEQKLLLEKAQDDAAPLLEEYYSCEERWTSRRRSKPNGSGEDAVSLKKLRELRVKVNEFPDEIEKIEEFLSSICRSGRMLPRPASTP